ncbi:amino acid/amide ABC transporter ATP-binding protein 1, HAAT family [Humidesulfovibrio mexicanus]|uniref:Amino acid/amide ABC transporter ATP-binding protein 1, HAAT family n=1 Tax=Humidesulfovibrio mexicanus TaxID=147047 RepID=A0A239AZY8_9BACT|nr:ABC transporter ATP-binding protein [Humidesulfovibrio mexicanus]SNS01059.1 amino acid/amide ABC transporter ATP-binding protein 1, HAAT family [Humidesulfovibrio mexicanus]
MDTNAKAVLSVRNISMNFGGLRALSDVDLEVRQGEVVALIGPNGAGKTTFFNCITGIYVPTEGNVLAYPREGGERRINGMRTNHVCELGMARTFQNIRLFPSMTALENVMIGRHCRTKSGILGAILRPPATRREEQDVVDRSYQLLKKVGLEDVAGEYSRNLPYGAQRRLEIARALATDPFLLLLDEPAAGMNPQETLELKEMVIKIREEFQVSVLLIEHDMKMVMSLSDRIYVMEYGRVISTGTPAEVSADPQVIRAYLGEESDA